MTSADLDTAKMKESARNTKTKVYAGGTKRPDIHAYMVAALRQWNTLFKFEYFVRIVF